MALFTGAMRFRTGLWLSATGLAGTVIGIYWDPINGRDLSAAGFGMLQTLLIAGGASLCILGAVLMALPRREKAPARAARRAVKPADMKRNPRHMRRKQRPLKKKARAAGRRPRNGTGRPRPKTYSR